MDVFPCGFSICGNKKGGKIKIVFVFAIRGEGKCKIKIKKKKSIFPLQGAFSLIFVGNLPEKIIRTFFGGKEKN